MKCSVVILQPGDAAWPPTGSAVGAPLLATTTQHRLQKRSTYLGIAVPIADGICTPLMLQLRMSGVIHLLQVLVGFADFTGMPVEG